jgi:hypothetical protein
MPEVTLRWGWFAAVQGIESGRWMRPGEAGDLIDVPTKTLGNWAKEGVISHIQMNPGEHHRYLREELEEINSRSRFRPDALDDPGLHRSPTSREVTMRGVSWILA